MQDDAAKIMALLEQGYVVKLDDRTASSFNGRYSIWQNLGEQAKVVLINEKGEVLGLQG